MFLSGLQKHVPKNDFCRFVFYFSSVRVFSSIFFGFVLCLCGICGVFSLVVRTTAFMAGVAFTSGLCCIYGGFVLCFKQSSGSACQSIYGGFVLCLCGICIVFQTELRECMSEHLRRVCVAFTSGVCCVVFQTGLG